MFKNNENIIKFPQILHGKEQQEDIVDLIALECFKKSDINGTIDELLCEYMKLREKIANTIKSEKGILYGLQKNKNNISVEDTVFDDYIICLEDGKKMQMLKRHLKTKYGMTFQQYKQKWGLPIDYPHVCKNYSKVRAKIAKKNKKAV